MKQITLSMWNTKATLYYLSHMTNAAKLDCPKIEMILACVLGFWLCNMPDF